MALRLDLLHFPLVLVPLSLAAARLDSTSLKSLPLKRCCSFVALRLDLLRFPPWLPSAADAHETPEQLLHWLPAHSLAKSRDLHLLTMATGVLLPLLAGKTELVVRGVYGAGKTQCIALLAAYFALRDTMSSMRLERTPPSLPWLPL